jgi:hypothetical protein
MQNDISFCMQEVNHGQQEKKNYLAWRRRRVASLAELEAEAGGLRTAAVALLFPVAKREVLPLPLSFVSFPFRFLSFFLPLWFAFPLSSPFFRFSLFTLTFLSLSVFSFSHFRVLPPLLVVLVVIY